MSDSGDATWIGNTQGQTHTGSGAQYNYYYFASGERLIRGGGDPLRMAADRRLWLSQRFVSPPGYREAVRRLEDAGKAVLISGADGSGRRTAAIVLLHRSGEPGNAFREVALDDRRDEPVGLEDGENVLADFSDVSEQQLADAQVLIRSYWEKVERAGGRLAVILPRGHNHLLQPDVRQLLVSIGRPDGGQVLTRHLRSVGIGASCAELQQSVLGPFLESSPMRELQRVAELVVQAGSEGGEFDTWAENAVAALRKRGAEAAEQISGLTDGRQRALLFTAAMLDEAPVPAVSRMCDLLLAKLGHPEDGSPRLDRDDLTLRLRDVRVAVEGERIRFSAFAYGAAVRDHFWLYYPDLRVAFAEWVREAIRETLWLDTPDRQRLVGRFTEQALKAGDVHALSELVEAWTQETRLLPEAIQVLGHGLLSEAHGAAFRRRIYDWSIGPRLKSGLVQVLARVCVDAVAPHHPDQALVRLHHLGRRPLEEGSRHARDALLELVGRDKRLYLRLLDRLCEGLERGTPVRSDVDIFLELVRELPSWAPHAEVVRGWRGVIAVASASKVWGAAVRNWLSTARRATDGGERLMRILVDAAAGRVGVLSRYYLLAHEWAVEPDDTQGLVTRAAVAIHFCQEIDRAQGIDPLVGATGGTRL